jgi:hypothetical protein
MTLFALLVSLLLPSPSSAPLAGFDLRLEREGLEWRVSCASGCAFSRATISCARDCEVIISSRGVQTKRDDDLATTAFAFVVTPQRDGWKAESLHGTAWRELSAHCAPGCATRIDETGVRLR